MILSDNQALKSPGMALPGLFHALRARNPAWHATGSYEPFDYPTGNLGLNVNPTVN